MKFKKDFKNVLLSLTIVFVTLGTGGVLHAAQQQDVSRAVTVLGSIPVQAVSKPVTITTIKPVVPVKTVILKNSRVSRAS